VIRNSGQQFPRLQEPIQGAQGTDLERRHPAKDVLRTDLARVAQARPRWTPYRYTNPRATGWSCAALRTFPTDLRVFSTPGETDIDRFQEGALFPGAPVAIAQASRDGEWLFVVSQRHAAWIEARHVAEGDAATVLGYAERIPHRLVTGAAAHTVHTPEVRAVSDVRLDMGTRLPLATSTGRVNSQHRPAATPSNCRCARTTDA